MFLVLLLVLGVVLGVIGSRLDLPASLFRVVEYVLALSVAVIVFVVGDRAGGVFVGRSDWFFLGESSILFVLVSIVFSLLAGFIVWLWVERRFEGSF